MDGAGKSLIIAVLLAPVVAYTAGVLSSTTTQSPAPGPAIVIEGPDEGRDVVPGPRLTPVPGPSGPSGRPGPAPADQPDDDDGDDDEDEDDVTVVRPDVLNQADDDADDDEDDADDDEDEDDDEDDD